MTKFIALDIETTSLSPFTGKIVGIAYHSEDGEGYCQDLEAMRALLADASYQKIFHNAVFDVSWLEYNGFKVNGIIHDTLLLAHLHDPDRDTLGLKDLSKELLGTDSIKHAEAMYTWLKDNDLKKEDMHSAPQDILCEYAKEDVRNTFRLFKHFCIKHRELKKWLADKGIAQNPWQYYVDELSPLIRVIVDMELRGVQIDLNSVAVKEKTLSDRIVQLERELTILNKKEITKIEEVLYSEKIESKKKKNKSGTIKKLPPKDSFNWDSGPHLKRLFFDMFKQKSDQKTKKGNLKLDADILLTFKKSYPWVDQLIELKELKKLVSTYLSSLYKLQHGGVIHANYKISGTATGRLSCNKPNLQNLPKHGDIKSLFIPRAGHKFIYADYSQLEYRLAAHLSDDQEMIAEFQKPDADLHQRTADILKISRDIAKTVNFAIIYNASGYRVMQILDLKSPEEGDKIISTLFSRYKGLKNYLYKEKQFMLKYGICVSEFGRIRRLKGLKSSDRKEYNHAFKSGFNMPIQSMGASICKRSMIELYAKGYKMCNQIHDSIVVEVPDTLVSQSISDIKSTMEGIYALKVPLLVEPKILTSFEEK